jgi:hypothetical protein
MPKTPGQPSQRGPAAPISQGERAWRNAFFLFSALMAALAMVDFDAGRFAHGLGDVGVACLMLSLMGQFPFVRTMVDAGSRESPAKTRDELLREAERLRLANPWAERLSHAGWMLLLASFALRLLGAA